MPFLFQKVSDFGTETPAVTRTLPQAGDLMQPFAVPEDLQERIKAAYYDLSERLVRCVDARDRVRREEERGLAQAEEIIGEGKFDRLPGVPNLRGPAESFLQGAKLAMQDVGSLVAILTGEAHDPLHNLNRAAAKLDQTDPRAKHLAAWNDSVHRVIRWRNRIDHPKDGCEFQIKNFEVAAVDGENALVPPTWGLADETPYRITTSMDSIIEMSLRIAEEQLALWLLSFETPAPISIHEIAKEDRDPRMPVRLICGLAGSPLGGRRSELIGFSRSRFDPPPAESPS